MRSSQPVRAPLLADAVDAAEVGGDTAALGLRAVAYGGLLPLTHPRVVEVPFTMSVWPQLIADLEYDCELWGSGRPTGNGGGVGGRCGFGDIGLRNH